MKTFKIWQWNSILTDETRINGPSVSQRTTPLHSALSHFCQRLCRRGFPWNCLSVVRRWNQRPIDPHTDRSLHLLTPSMSSEAVEVKGPFAASYVWDNGSIDTPSIHTWVVFCPVDAHYQTVLHQTKGALLKGPWFVLGSRTRTFILQISLIV